MAGIFISYRREDTEEVAGRLYDALKNRFGRDRVFRDVYALRPGEEYAKAIDRVITDADAVLVLIGPRWLAGTGESSSPRLQDPTDLLRREIATALSRGKWVIPVLVRGATMPVAAALPEDLAPLIERNAIELSDARWEYDVNQLERALRTRGVGGLQPRIPLLAAGVALVAVVAVGLVLALQLGPGRATQTDGIGLRTLTRAATTTPLAANVTPSSTPGSNTTQPPVSPTRLAVVPTNTSPAVLPRPATATPQPSNEATAVSRATPTPVSAAGPSPSPLPASRPTAALAVRPTCAVSTTLGFDYLLSLQVDLANKLGCPLDAERPVNGVYQLFERGELIWGPEMFATSTWTSEKTILVLAGSTVSQAPQDPANVAGHWHREADTWVEGQDPTTPDGFTAPSGLSVPIRGFGKVWRQTHLVNDLGYARQSECEFASTTTGPDGSVEAGNGAVEPFQNGWLYYTPLQGRVVWALIGQDRGDYYRFSEVSPPAARFNAGQPPCELLLR